MIVEKAFEQVQPLVNILNSKGFCIEPVANTPLANLVSASASPVGVSLAVPASGEYDASFFSCSQASAESDNETHNKLFDETITFLSTMVAQHVSNAKNVVAPVVMTLAEKIISRAQTEITPIKTYAIIPVALPAPMNNDGFKDSVIKASGGLYADPERYLKLQSIFAPEAVLQMMLTGSKDYDEKIKEWYASCGDSFFDKIWTSVFQDPSMDNKGQNLTLLQLFDDSKTGADAALAVYLISRNLFENIPENTGMTLVEYRRYLQQYKEAAAVKISRAYESYETEVKAGILVMSNDEMTKEVRVNSQTYLDYLKSGGKNEIILGAIVSGVVAYNVSKLSENQQQFIEAWDRHNLLTMAESKNKAIIRFRDIAYSSFLSELNTLSALEQEFLAENPSHIQKAQELGKQIAECITTEQSERPYDVALKLVCNARFYYTDAEKILYTINKVSEENKSIDVREAALIATTEYVIDYICDQIKVS